MGTISPNEMGSKTGHITLLIIQTTLANKVEWVGAIVLKLH